MSWKQKLRDRFEFLRRPPTGSTPQKRMRSESMENCPDDGSGDGYSEEEFDKDIKVKSGKSNGKIIRYLLLFCRV